MDGMRSRQRCVERLRLRASGAAVSQCAIYNDEGDEAMGSKATLVNLFAPGAPSRTFSVFLISHRNILKTVAEDVSSIRQKREDNPSLKVVSYDHLYPAIINEYGALTKLDYYKPKRKT